MRRLAIIGGGIAGLAAAYRAELRRRRGTLEYTLFEAAPRLGGVIRTELVDGCVVEGGPDSFLSEKPAAAALARELGLGDQLIGSSDAQRSTAIFVRGRPVPLPDGLMFLVPTRILPVAFSPLFSFRTKLAFAREWLRGPARPAPADDESVGDFVRRHFAPEVVDRLANPLLSGIYGGDAERLSARSVLPRLLEMEAKHGSLARAMLAARRQPRGPSVPAGAAPVGERRGGSLFTSLRGGMQQLVDAVTAELDAASVRVGTKVRALERIGDGWAVHTVKTVDAGEMPASSERFDAVVLAMPAYAAAVLLAPLQPELARELQGVPYSSSITVVLSYDAAAVRGVRMRGFGFLVPRSEGKAMLACTYVHHKFPHRAPPERALLRCFIGGLQAEEALQWPEERVLARMREELAAMIKLNAAPRFTRVFRWPRAMAQYEVGHGDRLRRIEQLRAQLPGLGLAGNAYRGIGVPDCIASGAAAVEALG